MPQDQDQVNETDTGGSLSTEFWAMVVRHVVAVVFVGIGAFSDNQHSSMLIVGGLSLLGVDAGFYTFGRTWLKSSRIKYKSETQQAKYLAAPPKE